MADAPGETTKMLGWIERMRAGDETARNELIRQMCGQLEKLTRTMLKGYPGVHRWEQTGDVLQNALMRLLRTLQDVRPGSMREFFGLASVQIRRELLDLVDKYYGPTKIGANHASWAGGDASAQNTPDAADSTGDPSRLAALKELHEKINGLPAEQREVVELLFYQGLTQAEAAKVLEVTVRTVQNHWYKALQMLKDILKEAWSEDGSGKGGA